MPATGPTLHVSVLTAEVLDWLTPQPGQVFADGTLGGGGHARALAERVGPAGCIVAVDRDPAALERATESLRGWPLKVAQASFCELPEVLAEAGYEQVAGVLLDLGLSSDQLADQERGFSFHASGPLDLRFDPTQGEPAYRLVNRLTKENLAKLIFELGEERYSRQIAAALERARQAGPLTSAAEIAEVVRRSVPRKQPERIDPATRTFQALRIAVNEELQALKTALQRLPDVLRPGGRIAVISFHSLEDRLVKEAFRDDPRLRALTRKPVGPSEQEIALNPRARSAKLRVAERL